MSVNLNFKLYGIVDIKGKAIVGVFTSPNDAAAERSFMNLITDPVDNIYNLNFEDFTLYHIADLGVNHGIVVAKPGSDILLDNGFTAGTIVTDDVILDGSSFTRDRILNLRAERKASFDRIYGDVKNLTSNVTADIPREPEDYGY